uniref:Acidic leucine-rich nuclear phosphoprotein 32 family member n=1 Tax=Sus scrofa TaxID=9823 RepID=A0A287BEL9_PIG
MEMKKRINLELRDRALEEVTELVLDNCLCVNGETEGLNDTFKKLEFLRMANVELSLLARLPKDIQDEEDDDNYIEGEEEEEEKVALQREKRKRDAGDYEEEEDD